VGRFKDGLSALVEMESGLRARSWGLSTDEGRLALYSALLLPLASALCSQGPRKNKPIAVSK
jgi:hypothetical protein